MKATWNIAKCPCGSANLVGKRKAEKAPFETVPGELFLCRGCARILRMREDGLTLEAIGLDGVPPERRAEIELVRARIMAQAITGG